MQIVVASNIGFCFGVKEAVEKSKELLKAGFKVFTDDDIVHNKVVMNELRKLGLSFKDGEIFLVRAHGLPKEKIEKLSTKYKIEDLTCKIVYNLFWLAEKFEKQGYQVVVFGKPNHPEMIAIRSYAKNAIVSLEPVAVEAEKIALLSQTTMSVEEFEGFANSTKQISKFSEFLIKNTICNVTVSRENETKRIARQVDLLFVVGGKHSSNTKKLARIASQYTNVVHVETAKEILETPSNVKSVGIVSGTSTPIEVVNKVVHRIKDLGGEQ
ncbi:4-hydroxy-3-methylbut-2-enyl diphosphate reductase [Thermosipho atlanticus]|uniref:4-hydroxy-3-methylbut-2-enyl diphosphate reductase n=1 Tax=Thermosipho atlanticus DSM 15807 TaxID=1123380 RepID=A0A1M5R961_9BACT|nr:4-hydroxy-3-methylbut-2-enyl diphosphate reductase [Thermosipho atlanticus]SHH22892.1 4-hydroxy-3-methylbut-2-enyl diphosphate reductase [Thermosipho atlanticus DSM 15807]